MNPENPFLFLFHEKVSSWAYSASQGSPLSRILNKVGDDDSGNSRKKASSSGGTRSLPEFVTKRESHQAKAVTNHLVVVKKERKGLTQTGNMRVKKIPGITPAINSFPIIDV